MMNAHYTSLAWFVWLLVAPGLLLLPSATSETTDMTDKASLEQEVTRMRALIAQQPTNTMAQLQLAAALHHLNHLSPDGGSRVPEAVNAYRAAMSGLSGKGAMNINIKGNLAALLLSADEAEAAINELHSALQDIEQQKLLLHQFAGLLFNLGKALTTVGRLEEADETYARAAAAAFGHDFGSYSKATAAPRALQDEAAVQAVQVAQVGRLYFQSQAGLEFLADVPVEGDVSIEAAMKGQQWEWIRAANSIELVWLHFALHKYYHGKKQYDLAWDYLDIGNKVMAALTPYKQAVEENNLRHIKAIFRAPIVSSGLQDRTPIFVVGMPRSGSTLVEQMLASHSEVYAAGEDTALAPMTPDINKVLSKPGVDHFKALRKFGRLYVKRMRERVPQRSWSSGSTGPKRIVDKMLRNLWLVGYIQMLLPKSCIIHVARHPMDVALSCYAQPFGYSVSSLSWAWDLDHIAQQLEWTWELADHWQQQLPGRVHTVLYEELVARPEKVARQLLTACGLDWEDSVLNFQATDRAVHTASMVQVRQPLYTSSVGRWKVYSRQLAALEQRLAPVITKYEQLVQQHVAAHGGGDLLADHVEDAIKSADSSSDSGSNGAAAALASDGASAARKDEL